MNLALKFGELNEGRADFETMWQFRRGQCTCQNPLTLPIHHTPPPVWECAAAAAAASSARRTGRIELPIRHFPSLEVSWATAPTPRRSPRRPGGRGSGSLGQVAPRHAAHGGTAMHGEAPTACGANAASGWIAAGHLGFGGRGAYLGAPRVPGHPRPWQQVAAVPPLTSFLRAGGRRPSMSARTVGSCSDAQKLKFFHSLRHINL
jgi:hypothetical protein